MRRHELIFDTYTPCGQAMGSSSSTTAICGRSGTGSRPMQGPAEWQVRIDRPASA
jgi:hypothetical protein